MIDDFSPEGIERSCADHGIPEYMVEAVLAHVLDGRTVGSFLTAVFANDFKLVVCKADDQNREALRGYALLLHNALPSQCHGSRERVAAWNKTGGLRGALRAALEAQR